ncbi:type 1 glutamine amidotransferase [Sedimentitalea sp. XS_ASV28]|uniref:type 1 glutamine amidotransferase n=1 Tax=Sedimentitalea sp. XS_ASV28 TaxID=3241296 RepID=UPI003515F14B
MKIGILQTGHAPDSMLASTGDYDRMFETLLRGHDFEFVNFAVVDNEFPDGADDAEGWLITGSKHGVYEDHPWIAPLEDLIREIAGKGLPLIGVCFGHQIIAQALGGKVEKFAGGWVVGATDYYLNGETLTLNAWHQDQVVELPEGARVIASNDFCQNAFVTYGDNIWTVQPHPEFGSDFIDGLIRTRGKGVVPDDVLSGASRRLADPIDNDKIAVQMAEFFKKGRTR